MNPETDSQLYKVYSEMASRVKRGEQLVITSSDRRMLLDLDLLLEADLTEVHVVGAPVATLTPSDLPESPTSRRASDPDFSDPNKQ